MAFSSPPPLYSQNLFSNDRAPGAGVTAVLGPTNTGKTHLAVERMLGHASGMIGLPLRLLAREIYDRVVAARGAASVALITGEEKIVPPRAHYFVCTVEAMPLAREVDFGDTPPLTPALSPQAGRGGSKSEGEARSPQPQESSLTLFHF